MTADQKSAALAVIRRHRIGSGTENRPETSIRQAAKRARINESYWRQIMAGGVKQSGVWVPRNPSPELLMDMATAVGAQDEVGRILGIRLEPDAPYAGRERRQTERRKPWQRAEPPQDVEELLNSDFLDLDQIRAWAETQRSNLGEDVYRTVHAICDQREAEWEQARRNTGEMIRRIVRE